MSLKKTDKSFEKIGYCRILGGTLTSDWLALPEHSFQRPRNMASKLRSDVLLHFHKIDQYCRPNVICHIQNIKRTLECCELFLLYLHVFLHAVKECIHNGSYTLAIAPNRICILCADTSYVYVVYLGYLINLIGCIIEEASVY